MSATDPQAEIEALVEALDDTRVARVERVLIHDGYATEEIEVTHASDAFAALDAAGPATFPVLLDRLRTTERASLRVAILQRLRVRQLWSGEHAKTVELTLRASLQRAPIDEIPQVVGALCGADVRGELLARVEQEGAAAHRIALLRAVPRDMLRPAKLTDAVARLLIESSLQEAYAVAPLMGAERVRLLLRDPTTRDRVLEVFGSFAEVTRNALAQDLLAIGDDPDCTARVQRLVTTWPTDTRAMRRLRTLRGDLRWTEIMGTTACTNHLTLMGEILERIADPEVPDLARAELVATLPRFAPHHRVSPLPAEMAAMVTRALTQSPALFAPLLGVLGDGELARLESLGPLQAALQDPLRSAEARRVLGERRSSSGQ